MDSKVLRRSIQNLKFLTRKVYNLMVVSRLLFLLFLRCFFSENRGDDLNICL